MIIDIAGIGIKFDFQPCSNISISRQLNEEISQRYGSFITKKPIKVDCLIKFVDFRELKTYIKERSAYVYSYKIISDSVIECQYTIGFYTLDLLLRNTIMSSLAKRQGFLFHGSSVKINNQASIFTGHSGAGKSTIMMMLAKKFSPLADETTIIKIEDKQINMYQTHLPEKQLWLHKDSQRQTVGRIYFIKQALCNKIEKIIDKKIIIKLMTEQLLTEKKILKNNLLTLIKLVKLFDQFYYFYFNLDDNDVINTISREV